MSLKLLTVENNRSIWWLRSVRLRYMYGTPVAHLLRPRYVITTYCSDHIRSTWVLKMVKVLRQSLDTVGTIVRQWQVQPRIQ